MASPGIPVTASGNATILIYLSLFLLLLVFFIVLTAHSQPRDYRVRAVLDSVGRSFAPADPSRTEAVAEFGPAAAVAVAGLRRIGELVETELAVVKVDPVVPGRLMVANLSSESLFEGDSARIRPERIGLLDRIAREIGERQGVRFEADFLVALGNEAKGKAGGADPVARAASMARALIIDRAPPDAIAVGVEPGASGTVRFLFSARLPGTAGGSHGRL